MKRDEFQPLTECIVYTTTQHTSRSTRPVKVPQKFQTMSQISLTQSLRRLRITIFDDTDAKVSGVAIIELKYVADVISGEHVTLLPCDSDDVVVHVTQVDKNRRWIGYCKSTNTALQETTFVYI